MRPWLLHVLRCPTCGRAPLRLVDPELVRGTFRSFPLSERPCAIHARDACGECRNHTVRSGRLVCEGCSEHPIEAFVPNLAGALAEAASAEAARMYKDLWEGFDVQRVAGEDDAQALATFRAKTGWDEARLAGRLLLDAGSGVGQLIGLLADAGALAVGADLVVAPGIATLEREERYAFVQCDLLHPPFVDGTFDHVYSIGVIHHIPDSERALRELLRTTDPGGELSVWVYDAHKSKLLGVDRAVRAVTVRLPHGAVKGLSVALSPLFPLARRLKGGDSVAISRADSEHLIYDWLKTPYRRFFEREELEAFFAEQGWLVRHRSRTPLGLTLGRAR